MQSVAGNWKQYCSMHFPKLKTDDSSHREEKTRNRTLTLNEKSKIALWKIRKSLLFLLLILICNACTTQSHLDAFREI